MEKWKNQAKNLVTCISKNSHKKVNLVISTGKNSIQLLEVRLSRDFPGGPMVKSPSSNAREMGSIPGWGTNIPQAIEQLSLCSATKA